MDYKAQINIKTKGGALLNFTFADYGEMETKITDPRFIGLLDLALSKTIQLEDKHSKLPERAPLQSAPQGVPQEAMAVPQCKSCGVLMFDNRTSKPKPTSPDFKCKNPQCNHRSGQYVGDSAWIKTNSKTGHRFLSWASEPKKPVQVADFAGDLPY